MRETIRPATAEDLAAAGVVPARGGRWLAVLQGERLLGVGGIVPAGAMWVASCRIQPEARQNLRAHRRALLEAARRVLELAQSRKMPVYAEPEAGIQTAGAFLAHLGFTRHPAGGYVREGER